MFPLVFNWCWHCMWKLRWTPQHCRCAQESKVRETDCAVCAMKAALYQILYRQLRCSRPLTNTPPQTSLCSMQHDSFNPTASVWFTRLVHKHWSGMDVHRTGTGRGSLQLLLLLLLGLPSCQQGLVTPVVRPRGQQDRGAGRRAHGGVTQNNGILSCPQLWLSWCGQLLLSSQSCSRSWVLQHLWGAGQPTDTASG